MNARRKNSPPEPEDHEDSDRVRFDKWLWAARFFKTRSLASTAIEAGKARVNGERVKPSRDVKPGDRVAIEKEGLRWEVEVLALSDRRGPASEAALLYAEGEDSRLRREAMLAERKAADAANPDLRGRPTKRMRRVLERLLKEQQKG
jgi:ribosome-associated heat shock protein Hsp15